MKAILTLSESLQGFVSIKNYGNRPTLTILRKGYCCAFTDFWIQNSVLVPKFRESPRTS